MRLIVKYALFPALFLMVGLRAAPGWASSTPVNITSVSAVPNTIGNQAQYTINIDIASDGGLTGTVDSMVVTFPPDTLVSNGSISSVTVEGVAAMSAIGIAASYQIDITPAQDLAGGTTAVTLVIPAAAVRNPTVISAYDLGVSTSQQPEGTSTPYTITTSGTSVTFGSVSPSPNYVGYQANYTINFNTSWDGALLGGVSQIIVTFPNNTVVTEGSLSGVTVEGLSDAWSTGSTSLRRITICPQQDISGSSTNVTLYIPSAAVRNPTTPSSYTLTLSTTVQPAGTSPSYSINPLPTATFTFTRTATRTPTPTRTFTPTRTHSPTFTISPTSTVTPTITLTSTPSPTVIATPTTTSSPFVMSSETVMAYPVPATGNDLWFSYSTLGPAEVTIDIHAITGERVHSLSDSAPAAGTRRVRWDIETVAPGVYLYRLLLQYPDKTVASKFEKFVIIKR